MKQAEKERAARARRRASAKAAKRAEQASELGQGLRLLTIRELSAISGLTKWTLYEIVRGARYKKGKAAAPLPPPPPFVRLGGKQLRFPEHGVTKWLRDLTNNTNTKESK